MLTSAVAVSTPLDLTAAGLDIDRGLNRIYAWHFLWTLKPKSRELARRYPSKLDQDRVRRVYSMYEFDNTVTAPLHGFAGTLDYWKRGFCKPWLARHRHTHPRPQREERSVRSGRIAPRPE